MNIVFQIAFYLVIAPVLTCLIEVPIQRGFKITKETKYLIAINLVTNYTYNLVLAIFTNAYRMNYQVQYGWIFVSEALWIPILEAFLLTKISKVSKKKIYLVTYLANITSFLVGLLLTRLVLVSYL